MTTSVDEVVVRAIIKDELSKGLVHISDEIKHLERNADRANKGVIRLGGGMTVTAGQVKRLDGTLRTASASLAHFTAQSVRAGSIGLGTLGVAATGFGLKSEASFQRSRIAFGTLLGDVTRGNALFTQLQGFNLQTPFNLQEISSATQTLLQFGFSGENVMSVLKGISDVSATTQNPGENLGRIAVALGQINGAGVLRAQDLNQLVQAGFPAYQLLQQITGQTMAELRKQMESGLTVPAEKFIAAVQAQSGVLAKYAGGAVAQSRTLSGVWSNFSDTIQVRLATAFQPLADALSLQLPVFTTTLGAFIDATAPAIANVALLLLSAANTFLPLVQPVIKALLEGIGALLQSMAPALTMLQPVMGDLGASITEMVSELLPHMPALVEAFVALVALLPQMVAILGSLLVFLSPLTSLVSTLAGMKGAAAGLLAVLLGYRVLSTVAEGVLKMALALRALREVQDDVTPFNPGKRSGGAGGAGGGGGVGAVVAGAGKWVKRLGIAGGALSVAGGVFDAYSGGLGVDNFLSSVAGGATAGAMIGGPWGAAIGGLGAAGATMLAGIFGGGPDTPTSEIWDPSRPGYGGYVPPGGSAAAGGGSVDNSLNVGAINVINPTNDVDVQRAIEEYQYERSVRR